MTDSIPKNLISEDSNESVNTDSSGKSQTVTELMAALEHEVLDLGEVRESSGPQLTTTSEDSSNRLPEETWKKMTHSQRKNYLRQQKRATSDVTQPKEERKRNREKHDTPSPANVVKKPKMDYVGAASIKVAVAHQDYPHQKLREKNFQALMHKLLMRIRERDPELESVRFNGYSLRDGALVVNCKDEITREWFIQNIGELSPWEGAPLKTCDPKELEGFRKMGVFIPSPVDGIKECLQTLHAQNKDLQVSRWKVLGSKAHQHGMYMVASIPESAAKVLEEGNGRLYHGFHNLQVRFFAGKDAAGQRAAVDRETTGSGGMVSTGGEGATVPVAGVSAPGSASCPSVSGTAELDFRRQKTEHKGRRDRGARRQFAGASVPEGRRSEPGSGKEETPPPPGENPPS